MTYFAPTSGEMSGKIRSAFAAGSLRDRKKADWK